MAANATTYHANPFKNYKQFNHFLNLNSKDQQSTSFKECTISCIENPKDSQNNSLVEKFKAVEDRKSKRQSVVAPMSQDNSSSEESCSCIKTDRGTVKLQIKVSKVQRDNKLNNAHVFSNADERQQSKALPSENKKNMETQSIQKQIPQKTLKIKEEIAQPLKKQVSNLKNSQQIVRESQKQKGSQVQSQIQKKSLDFQTKNFQSSSDHQLFFENNLPKATKGEAAKVQEQARQQQNLIFPVDKGRQSKQRNMSINKQSQSRARQDDYETSNSSNLYQIQIQPLQASASSQSAYYSQSQEVLVKNHSSLLSNESSQNFSVAPSDSMSVALIKTQEKKSQQYSNIMSHQKIGLTTGNKKQILQSSKNGKKCGSFSKLGSFSAKDSAVMNQKINFNGKQHQASYPNKINLTLKFNECLQQKIVEEHRKSLDDVAFATVALGSSNQYQQYDILNQIDQKGQDPSNATEIQRKESLQQFLSKDKKDNHVFGRQLSQKSRVRSQERKMNQDLPRIQTKKKLFSGDFQNSSQVNNNPDSDSILISSPYSQPPSQKIQNRLKHKQSKESVNLTSSAQFTHKNSNYHFKNLSKGDSIIRIDDYSKTLNTKESYKSHHYPNQKSLTRLQKPAAVSLSSRRPYISQFNSRDDTIFLNQIISPQFGNQHNHNQSSSIDFQFELNKQKHKQCNSINRNISSANLNNTKLNTQIQQNLSPSIQSRNNQVGIVYTTNDNKHLKEATIDLNAKLRSQTFQNQSGVRNSQRNSHAQKSKKKSEVFKQSQKIVDTQLLQLIEKRDVESSQGPQNNISKQITTPILDSQKFQDCLSACKSPASFKKNLHYNQPKLIKRDRGQVIRILYHVARFVSIDTLIKLAHTSKKFSKLREVKFILNQQFRTLVVKGLSTFERLNYWNYRTRFVYYRTKYKNLYKKIISEKKSEYQSDIQKDLDRTFPQLKHFAKGNLGQDQLERLLTAISIYYKKLGYVQGMNFIVGTVMLSFQSEEDAFWMIISMLVNFKLDQLLTFEKNKFKILCFQIDMFVKAYLPNLYDIFKENNLSSEFYASQWLFTFFSIDLPFDIVYIVMDLFLLEGYSALIRICLALLKIIESQLAELSFDESLVFLKTFGRNLDTDSETFFEIAMSFKIQKQMCRDLEDFFQKNYKDDSEQVLCCDLIFDHETSKWSIAPIEKTDQSQDVKEEQKAQQVTAQEDSQQIKNNQNATNTFGQKMQNFLKWFKKEKKTASPQISDDIASEHEENDKSSHRSADIEEQLPALQNFTVTPQSQHLPSIPFNALTQLHSRNSETNPLKSYALPRDYKTQVREFSTVLLQQESQLLCKNNPQSDFFNESIAMSDIREGPRLNLPTNTLMNSNFHHKVDLKSRFTSVMKQQQSVFNNKNTLHSLNSFDNHRVSRPLNEKAQKLQGKEVSNKNRNEIRESQIPINEKENQIIK